MGVKSRGFSLFIGVLCAILLSSDAVRFRNSDTNSVFQRNARRKLDDIAGSINIDCGLPDDSSYTDATTDILYISDRTFINTGESKTISSNFTSTGLPSSLANVRSFPEGHRHCYTLRPPEGKSSIYLIRASFMYGNYDNQYMLPKFSLYVGVNLWDSVKFDNASHVVMKEIIHVPLEDNIYVCLLNTGEGTPFISTLELRHFHNATYRTDSGSLLLYQRLDFGSRTNQVIRYHDDIYDRIWFPYNLPFCESIYSTFPVDSVKDNDFNLPSNVMTTAARPRNGSDVLNFEFETGDMVSFYYIYMHFAELESLSDNEHREFNIELNGKLFKEGIVPYYLRSTSLPSPQPVRGPKLSFSLRKSVNSTHPPILNAMEVYAVRTLSQAPTEQQDVEAIQDIRSRYSVDKGWQGDPCQPVYSWDGLNCSNKGYNPPRIISVDLSSSGLSGYIPPSLSKLRLLQHLDLSNNSLTGRVPEFLTQLPELITLNLEGNKLSGLVPLTLVERFNNGSLSLRVDGNPGICWMAPCTEEKKNTVMVPILAAVVPVFVIVVSLIVVWIYRKRNGIAEKKFVSSENAVSSLKSVKRQYKYVEIVKMTNNFETVVGKGGFGTVYHGFTPDGIEVAVKMLPASSADASSQFRTEARLLMRVHHKNLTAFIGYCNDNNNIGIIYEYMEYGNLDQYLFDKNREPLSWRQRLQIALDAALGLEYLHHGCKPPIIHRDVKSANILLDDRLQAKIADFGFSKNFSLETGSHFSTIVVGTVGYVDPEYYASNRLTEKSDVYSFGVVLLELITGMPAVMKNHDENIHITNWVASFLERGDVRSAVDPRLQGNVDTNSVWKLMEIAMSCVPSISIQRPSMSHVVIELKDCLRPDVGGEHGMEFEGRVVTSTSSFDTRTKASLDSEIGPEPR